MALQQDGRIFRAIAWRAAERHDYLDRAQGRARRRVLPRTESVQWRDVRRADPRRHQERQEARFEDRGFGLQIECRSDRNPGSCNLNPQSELMARWQRRPRLVIALGAVAVVVAVAFAFQRRSGRRDDAVVRSDPKALVESFDGDKTRHQSRQGRSQDRGRDDASPMATARPRCESVTVTTERSGGRTFIVTVGPRRRSARTSRSIHAGGRRAIDRERRPDACRPSAPPTRRPKASFGRPGRSTFSRGRMTGSGVGLTYDKNQDRLRS